MLSTISRVRSTRPRLLVLVAAVAAILVLSSCSPQQREALDLVNMTRMEHGLDPLYPHNGASEKAQAWAEHLVQKGSLEHSKLPDGIAGDWRKIGENVGYGGSIEIVHDAYMNSPGHRANILDPAFNFVGTGVAEDPDSGRVYTVQVFVKY